MRGAPQREHLASSPAVGSPDHAEFNDKFSAANRSLTISAVGLNRCALQNEQGIHESRTPSAKPNSESVCAPPQMAHSTFTAWSLGALSTNGDSGRRPATVISCSCRSKDQEPRPWTQPPTVRLPSLQARHTQPLLSIGSDTSVTAPQGTCRTRNRALASSPRRSMVACCADANSARQASQKPMRRRCRGQREELRQSSFAHSFTTEP